MGRSTGPHRACPLYVVQLTLKKEKYGLRGCQNCYSYMILDPNEPCKSLVPWCIYRRFGCCASSFGRSPETGNRFRFVRAGGRGEAVCLREGDDASLRWPSDSRILVIRSLALAYSRVEYCLLHGFEELS